MNDTEVSEFISTCLSKMQLAEMRKSKNITKKELSEKTGLSVKCISDIENSDSGNPTMKSIIKYLDFFGYELYFKNKTI